MTAFFTVMPQHFFLIIKDLKIPDLVDFFFQLSVKYNGSRLSACDYILFFFMRFKIRINVTGLEEYSQRDMIGRILKMAFNKRVMICRG